MAIVLPGLFDLQVNGWNGVDFNAPGLGTEAILAVTEGLAASGTAAFLPTVVTNAPEAMESAISALAAAAAVQNRETSRTATARAKIAGIHIEGPFISPAEGPRGAHDPAYVVPPQPALIQRLRRAAGGLRLMLTFAPEVEGALDLVRWCLAEGIVPAIGHTGADSISIARAVDTGAIISTHLGNGCTGMLPRHPNPLWDQLAEDRLFATMIADGHHLPDAVMRVFLRTKGERLMLVSDATSFTGMPAGRYHAVIGGDVVLSAEGRLSIADRPGTLAGAARSLLDGVLHLVESDILGLEEAWALASTRPARFWGLACPPFAVLFDPVSRRIVRTVGQGDCHS